MDYVMKETFVVMALVYVVGVIVCVGTGIGVLCHFPQRI